MTILNTIFSILGISSLIGTVLAHFLSTRREKRIWVKDNKKAEWRELIQVVDASLDQMSYAFQPVAVSTGDDHRTDPWDGMANVDLAIQNRIFIADALVKSGIVTQWKRLEKLIVHGSKEDLGHGDFTAKSLEFKEQLLQIARKDLGL
jgi:hypothetical protein